MLEESFSMSDSFLEVGALKKLDTTARYTLNSAQQWRTRDLIFPGFSQKTNTINSVYNDSRGPALFNRYIRILL